MKSVNSKKYDVLKVYQDGDSAKQQTIMKGGLDTGIDYGKLSIDTSSNMGPNS